ncbi:unnamed protein product, partial [Meganyctiphanes norvegica]
MTQNTPLLLTLSRINLNKVMVESIFFYSFSMGSGTQTISLHSGSKLPVVGLGTDKSKGNDVAMSVNAALECGYRHIDTAFAYKNEAEIGKVLSEWFESGRLKREDLFITTKLPTIGNRFTDVTPFINKSLDALNVQYLDMFLIHSPVGLKRMDDDALWPVDSEGNLCLDNDTNLEELWKGMEAEVIAGRTRAIGLSNYNSTQINRIMKSCSIKPAILQIEVHAYHQQPQLLKLARQLGIAVCAYAPLGAPYKQAKAIDNLTLLIHPVVVNVAKCLEKSPAQVLIRFLIQQNITVIPMSSKPKHLSENIQVFDFELNLEQMEALTKLDKQGKGRMFSAGGSKGAIKHPEYPFNISS